MPEPLAPGAYRDYAFAIVYGRGDDHLASVGVMKRNSDYVQNAFDFGALTQPAPALPLPSPAPPPPTPTFALGRPTPNPASGTVELRYGLGGAGYARLAVYDALGRLVALPVAGVREAEAGEVALDVSAWAPGVYAAVLEAEGQRAVRRFTVAR